jgi:hypothetical protein
VKVRVNAGSHNRIIPATIKIMARRVVTPYATASRNAHPAPTVLIHSINISNSPCNKPEFLSEPRSDQLIAFSAVTLPLLIENQIAPSVYVFVVLQPVLPKHPHELGAAPTDPLFKRRPVRRLSLDASMGLRNLRVAENALTPLHKHPPCAQVLGSPGLPGSSLLCILPSRYTFAAHPPKWPDCHRSCHARMPHTMGIEQSSSSRSFAVPQRDQGSEIRDVPLECACA